MLERFVGEMERDFETERDFEDCADSVFPS